MGAVDIPYECPVSFEVSEQGLAPTFPVNGVLGRSATIAQPGYPFANA
jgi:hypothetical protein